MQEVERKLYYCGIYHNFQQKVSLWFHVNIGMFLSRSTFFIVSLSLRMIVFVHTQKSFIQIRELDYSLHFYFAKDFVDIAVAHSILLLLPCTQTKASIVSNTICLIKMCYGLAEYIYL